MDLPLNYIVDTFYRYSGAPVYRKYRNTYNASCPICREGNSWLRKKRCYYIVSDNYICCHNCSRTWSPIQWIKEVSGMEYKDVLKDAAQYDTSLDEIVQRYEHKEKKEPKTSQPTLPHDSINLLNDIQLKFYKGNEHVRAASLYIRSRRLTTAINRPKTFYMSLNDKFHRNRLVIPFYDERGKIIFYQSRALNERDDQYARYLSKVDSKFSTFGVNNIDNDYEYLFLFEGPIDSMFVKNGLAMGGLHTNALQDEQLQKYWLHKKIWVLDNQLDNKEVKKKYHQLIDSGESIFVYPEKFKDFKDINEVCVQCGLDRIPAEFFLKHSYSGMNALLKLGL
jgi:hypothetical protein